jgi:UDPglucose--hexose-1-phosphate uridylyltransferase
VSELRFNELRGEQVDYAIHRQERTFLPSRDHCPLCPTQPGEPPTEIPLPAFEIAVFDNRFPAFTAPHGASEVVVYTDDHDASFGTLAPERAEALMWVWRHRYLELGARQDVDYVFIFENRGVEVGVTLHHPHGQIYGYPFVPPTPEREAVVARTHGCAVCAEVEAEVATGARIVTTRGSWVAWVPYASGYAYGMRIAPRAHVGSLSMLDDASREDLTAVLTDALARYDRLWPSPDPVYRFPYLLWFHQAPAAGGDEWHLHAHIAPPLRAPGVPRFVASNEVGSGTWSNPVVPEAAAQALRDA